MKRILTIAGSDSSGGAGIQADIKTITALGGYAMSVITAITAQNTLGVQGVHAVPVEMVAQQITSCLTDIGADAIKLGMLLNADIIEAVKATICVPKASHSNQEKYIQLARTLRHTATDAEQLLWQLLRNRQMLGLKFRRQHPVAGYIADFACTERHIIIELDGGQHHSDEGKAADEKRTQALQQAGWSVLRYSNLEMLQQTEAVLAHLYEQLASPSPALPRARKLAGQNSLSSTGGKGWGEGETPPPIILDPVMVATSGDRLLDDAALSALIDLMQHASLITPNLPEAEMLTGLRIDSQDSMFLAAHTLAKMTGGTAMLLKGGHLQGDTLYDLLYQGGEVFWYESERIDSQHTHGTGCTLASAIATIGAQGNPLFKAVELARDYVHQAIRTAPEFGKGHGPLNHLR